MVDSRREVPVTEKHFAEHGYTVPEEILALVTAGELKDLSWHMDGSPCYGIVLLDEVNVCIWVDHVEMKKREAEGERFWVSSYNHEHVDLHPRNDGQLGGTDDVAEAITKWRETVADLKRQIDARTPKTCEACNVALNPDLTCPKCGVSHTAAPCATCGRVGLHKDDCTEPPSHDTEGGPAYVAPLTTDQVSALVKTFKRAYQYYNGWGFEYMEPPGCFSYYQLGGDLRVFFTPDWSDAGMVDVQVQSDDGAHADELAELGGDVAFKTDRNAPALFMIVKPYLDKLTGKTAKDFVK